MGKRTNAVQYYLKKMVLQMCASFRFSLCGK